MIKCALGTFRRKIGKDVFVELDVGSDNNSNEKQIRGVLFSVVKDGTIASYDTSVIGFQFRRLGEGMLNTFPIMSLFPYEMMQYVMISEIWLQFRLI